MMDVDEALLQCRENGWTWFTLDWGYPMVRIQIQMQIQIQMEIQMWIPDVDQIEDILLKARPSKADTEIEIISN